jgi:purine-binding chemotaxis protein CheW
MMATAAARISRPEGAALAIAQIVTFRVGEDLFAADVRAVERVLRYQTPRPVPSVPPWVEGVIDYQKRIVPLIQFRTRFELDTVDPSSETRIIVFNTAGGWTAGVVDAVLDVAAVGAGGVTPPPPLFRGLAAEYLHGVARRNGALVLVINADRLLSATERILLERATQSRGSGQRERAS